MKLKFSKNAILSVVFAIVLIVFALYLIKALDKTGREGNVQKLNRFRGSVTTQPVAGGGLKQKEGVRA